VISLSSRRVPESRQIAFSTARLAVAQLKLGRSSATSARQPLDLQRDLLVVGSAVLSPGSSRIAAA